jgi:Reverse transcriptase (RNA-dependent DNA polymerase)
LVDKFRNIHIYECDLNDVLAIKWKAAIYRAKESNQISESQFGSRRGKSTQTPILMEILQQDISRLTRRSYGQINYDAKACYDRILPNLASIVSHAFRVPKSIVKLHNHLLHNMKYSVTVPGSQKEWNFFTQQINQCMALVKGLGIVPMYGQ